MSRPSHSPCRAHNISHVVTHHHLQLPLPNKVLSCRSHRIHNSRPQMSTVSNSSCRQAIETVEPVIDTILPFNPNPFLNSQKTPTKPLSSPSLQSPKQWPLFLHTELILLANVHDWSYPVSEELPDRVHELQALALTLLQSKLGPATLTREIQIWTVDYPHPKIQTWYYPNPKVYTGNTLTLMLQTRPTLTLLLQTRLYPKPTALQKRSDYPNPTAPHSTYPNPAKSADSKYSLHILYHQISICSKRYKSISCTPICAWIILFCA